MIKLVIVDDHQIIRAGLELMFETMDDIEVLGTADNGVTGLAQITKLQPDLVLTDIRMPEMDGIELIKQLHQTTPNLPVVVLTTFDDQRPIQQAMQLGARLFVEGCGSSNDSEDDSGSDEGGDVPGTKHCGKGLYNQRHDQRDRVNAP